MNGCQVFDNTDGCPLQLLTAMTHRSPNTSRKSLTHYDMPTPCVSLSAGMRAIVITSTHKRTKHASHHTDHQCSLPPTQVRQQALPVGITWVAAALRKSARHPVLRCQQLTARAPTPYQPLAWIWRQSYGQVHVGKCLHHDIHCKSQSAAGKEHATASHQNSNESFPLLKLLT
jgi:hypothetical protein